MDGVKEEEECCTKRFAFKVAFPGDGFLECSSNSKAGYTDMYTHCQDAAVRTGDSTTAVARNQLCGRVSSATTQHATMEDIFSVGSVPGRARLGTAYISSLIRDHDPLGWRSLKNRTNEMYSTENYRPDFSSEKAPHIIKSIAV
jgi:hypothetical protein